ncbi:RNA recognition motif domain [Macleaya cordata]|uniref:RNA recognition motif domain n=1 Tax=Macleaya cordata TaxID=56857 RepID=A0A200RCB4_MACCD|nr:RNA recognition motif domain [Macleaya cordata]
MATPSLEEETANKVLRQVEFYFSDSNLPRDGFLKKSINESEDGMVSLALICSFSRMRNHLGLAGDVKPENVSEDTVKSVAEVLRKSAVLRVSEDGKKIGRSTELLKLEEVVEQLDIRTIAASPLEHDVTIEEVESFFSQYAKVNSVRLPRHVADKRFFCGTALIEFSTEEDAANVLTQSLVYAGAELELKPKKDFDAEREKLIEEVEKSRLFKGPKSKSNSDMNSDYPKGLIIAFKLKHTSGEGIAEQNGIQNATEKTKENASENVENGVEKSLDDMDKESKEVVVKETTEEGEEKDTEDAIGKSEEKSPDDGGEETEEKAVTGEKLSAAINKDNKDIVLREDIKNALHRFGTVKYVDFRMGADSGYVRFEEPEAGQKARAAAVLAEEGGLIVKNYIAFLEAVTAASCPSNMPVRLKKSIGAYFVVVRISIGKVKATVEGVVETLEEGDIMANMVAPEKITRPLGVQIKLRRFRLNCFSEPPSSSVVINAGDIFFETPEHMQGVSPVSVKLSLSVPPF